MNSRNERVGRLVADARNALASGLSRAALASILADLMALAADAELWTAADLPDPGPNELQARYLIREDADRGFALYCNVMRPGKLIPPHNHTTWACVAAVSGTECNTLFDRTDGRTGPGSASLRVASTIDVKPGTGIALMPEDIHSVQIRGDAIIRHLHFYGRALETLSGRLVFDLAAGTARPMVLEVATRRRG